MKRILVCIDGSAYADLICTNAAWVAKQLGAEIDLLHVLRRHSAYEAPSDHTGSIGLGARSELLEELTKVDQERGRLDQQKGKLILQHGVEVLQNLGVSSVNTIHRRGSLVDTLQELEESAELIVMGKRGEHANPDSVFLGSNLEKVARAIHKPLFVVSSVVRPKKSFVIAYDGKQSVGKAIEYIVSKPLFAGMTCHLLTVEVGSSTPDTKETQARLRDAGFELTVQVQKASSAEQAIASYVAEHEIDIVVTGAYSHSRFHSLLLGSTTTSLITSCRVPLVLFR